ncbi:LppU/SCO3897 family protein [Amycolatopsis benzoatilytica]|uniref:LppU/SCO3897 family protein n=1 Tax=Amycolatopsis benzoatilytica TaxID=346045 RepID=UPI0004845B25|nr:hypothetical protein [Amycolatopsis benzoatilytica]
MSVPPPAPGGQPPVGPSDPYGTPGQPGPAGYGQPMPGGAPYPGQPYPGQPNGGPQPGQPPFDGQPVPPPGQTVFPAPAPKSKMRFVRLGLVLLLVIGGIVAGIVSFTTSPDYANAGECLKITEFKQGANPDKVDCGDPSANVKIGVRVEGKSDTCPAGNYDRYQVSGGKDYLLCLMLNVKQGDCLKNVKSDTAGYQKVSCTDPAAEAEILKVIDGKADEQACAGTDASGGLTYAEPKTTICVKLKN